MTRVTLLTAIYSDVCLRKLRFQLQNLTSLIAQLSGKLVWLMVMYLPMCVRGSAWTSPLLQRGCLMSQIHMRLHASIGYTPITAFHSQRRWCVGVLSIKKRQQHARRNSHFVIYIWYFKQWRTIGRLSKECLHTATGIQYITALQWISSVVKFINVARRHNSRNNTQQKQILYVIHLFRKDAQVFLSAVSKCIPSTCVGALYFHLITPSSSAMLY